MFRTLILASILSLLPLTANAQPPDVSSARWQRIEWVVTAQQHPDGTDGIVIMEMNGTDYAATITVDGQSVSYVDLSGYNITGRRMERLAVLSVATFEGDAWCRILDARGRVLRVVQGGNAATCSVIGE